MLGPKGSTEALLMTAREDKFIFILPLAFSLRYICSSLVYITGDTNGQGLSCSTAFAHAEPLVESIFSPPNISPTNFFLLLRTQL